MDNSGSEVTPQSAQVVRSGGAKYVVPELLQQWRDDLKDWVWTNILSVVLTENEKEIAHRVCENTNFKPFEDAFTHESYDYSNNYELYETLGDAIMTQLAIRYFTNFPGNYRSAQISELKSYYTSNLIQSTLLNEESRKLVRIASGIGLDRYSVMGDIVESIYGALDTVFESILPGTGQHVCWKLFTFHYDRIEIDHSVIYGNYKTQVTQIFSRFGEEIGTPVVWQRDSYNKAEVIVKLTDLQYQLINSKGNVPKVEYIGSAVGESITEAEELAYKQALEFLAKYGITMEWAKSAKMKEDLASEEMKPYIANFDKRLQEEGYESVSFETSRKMSTKTRKVILLVGISGNERTLLAATEGSQQTYQTKKELVAYYSNYDDVRNSTIWKEPNRQDIYQMGEWKYSGGGTLEKAQRAAESRKHTAPRAPQQQRPQVSYNSPQNTHQKYEKKKYQQHPQNAGKYRTEFQTQVETPQQIAKSEVGITQQGTPAFSTSYRGRGQHRQQGGRGAGTPQRGRGISRSTFQGAIPGTPMGKGAQNSTTTAEVPPLQK